MDWLEEIGKQDAYFDEHISSLNIENNQEFSEWELDRIGKFTSSRLGDLMTKGRAKDQDWGGMAMNYIYEKIAELITGVPHFKAESKSIQWGNDHEALAIDKYNEDAAIKADHMGETFVKFSDMCGVSPDAYVGEDGILEVKCPYNSANHIKTCITGEISKAHMFQCQGNMLFSDRKWCDFVSYDPRMPESIQLKIIRIDRDYEIGNQILNRISEAVKEIERIVQSTGIELSLPKTI